jgi:hypothetical protein
MEDDGWFYRFSSDSLENITTRFLRSDSPVSVNRYNFEVKPQSVFTPQCLFLSSGENVIAGSITFFSSDMLNNPTFRLSRK